MFRTSHERAALALLAVLPACSLLPEGHGAVAATEGFARALRGMTAGAHAAWADTTRRVATLGHSAQAFPGRATDEATGLLHELSSKAHALPSTVATGARQLSASVDGVRDRGESDLLHLLRTTDLLAGVNAGARAVRGAFERAVAVPRLDRRAMAEPSDPERTTDLEPAGRTRTWFERMLRRLGLTP